MPESPSHPPARCFGLLGLESSDPPRAVDGQLEELGQSYHLGRAHRELIGIRPLALARSPPGAGSTEGALGRPVGSSDPRCRRCAPLSAPARRVGDKEEKGEEHHRYDDPDDPSDVIVNRAKWTGEAPDSVG